jgi:hypothetical protein
MDSILPNELTQCADPIELTTLLAMRSVTNVFTEQNKDFADIAAIYRWAITIKVGSKSRSISFIQTNLLNRLPTTRKSSKGLVTSSLSLEPVTMLPMELRSST